MECFGCGLVFLSPRMTAEAYAKFYDGPYRKLVSAFHGREINAETIEAEQWDYALEVKDVLIPYLDFPLRPDRNWNLLDIGGSTGVVGHVVAGGFGIAPTVLDPCPAELERARGYANVIRGTIESFDPAGRTWDVILLCQTVDHLLDISGSLAKIRTMIAPDGVFWVDIVDYGRRPEIKIDHPYYLTPTTMGAHLRKAGFEVKHVEPAPDGVHVGFVCVPGVRG